jgi:uncharacterized protein (TIGR02391 family)
MASSDYSLPDDIAKSHARLTQLFETCARLSFHDVARTLRHVFEQERTKGFDAWAELLDRLPNYVEHHLSQKIQDQLNAQSGLMSSFRRTVQIAERRPENWPFWGTSDYTLVESRRASLIEEIEETDPKSERAKECATAIARLNRILTALDELKKVNRLAVNASDIDSPIPARPLLDYPIEVCPLTGLALQGRAIIEAAQDGNLLYRFPPIGSAFFPAESFRSLVSAALHTGYPKPFTDIAGICRQASELGQEPLVFTPGVLTSILEGDGTAIPRTFEEKRLHFLRLLCEAGGYEHQERDINTLEDFPMAFAASSEQFFRIIKSLASDGLIQHNKQYVVSGDWVKNIQTRFYEVLPTRAGKQASSAGAMVKPVQEKPLPFAPASLTHLHPIIQQAAGSLFATSHYRQAILDAYIALDNAVREKSQLTGTGTRLMEVAFSPGNPVLKISDSQDEQQGFMALFRGAMLAIRNPKAHSLNGTHDEQRALEWLSFASVLLRNLDEAVLQQPNPPIQ